jgi:hypothetical protein
MDAPVCGNRGVNRVMCCKKLHSRREVWGVDRGFQAVSFCAGRGMICNLKLIIPSSPCNTTPLGLSLLKFEPSFQQN